MYTSDAKLTQIGDKGSCYLALNRLTSHFFSRKINLNLDSHDSNHSQTFQPDHEDQRVQDEDGSNLVRRFHSTYFAVMINQDFLSFQVWQAQLGHPRPIQPRALEWRPLPTQVDKVYRQRARFVGLEGRRSTIHEECWRIKGSLLSATKGDL